MKNYTKITAEDVKIQFSTLMQRYIGPKAAIKYKQAARELEVEERTLGSWVRGEKQITCVFLLKIMAYLPENFTEEFLDLTKVYKHK
ncbi:MAG: hypothetical protein AABY27_02025 [Pseudomonadota bacterium]